MPSFKFAVPDLVVSGPTLQVLIGPSRAFIEAVGETGIFAAPFAVTALVDTGAQTTVLSPDVVTRLGIRPVGSVPIITLTF